MKKIYFLLAIAIIGCKEDEPIVEPTGQVTIELTHKANGQTAEFDTLKYSIPSGFDLSLTRWEYYISGIYFYDANDNQVYKNVNAHYINGRYADTWDLALSSVPTGNVSKIKLTIGLVPEINVSHGLPNTAENIGMAWPDVMGGGYHFMKLEGHFKKVGPSAGYAMHLGENGYQVDLEFPVTLSVTEGESKIMMDIDAIEWFKNPNDWDFDIDDNYTMGVPAMMQKLTDNGQTVIYNVTAP